MASTVFNLGGVKVLKNILRFQTSEVQIITGQSADPTVTAVDAVAGSIYIRNTGEIYIKNSSGSNTDFRVVSSQAALDAHVNALTDAHDASAISNVPSGNLSATNVQSALDELQSDIDTRATSTALSDHVNDAVDAHDASAISNIPSGNLAATDVQAALNELQSDIDTRALSSDLTAHLNDTVDAHDASAISNVPSGNLAATDVQSALDELQSDIDTRATVTALNAHINNTTDAHDASAISNVPAGNLAATDVQAALNELQSDIDTRALDNVVIKKDGSVAFTAAQSMGGFKLTSLANGTAASDAVNKGQLDAALEGLKPKAAARVATTANITIATDLNAGDVIDGITLANGDRVLVKDQSSASQNGIYVVSATPARSTDFDSLSPIDEINGSLVAIQEGTSNAGKVFVQSGTVAVLDTDPINFVFFNSSASLVGGDGITVSGSNISVDHDGQGLTFSATQLALELDGTTLSKSAAGLKVNSITSAEVSDFTEAAQDAVAAALLDSSKIDFIYNDAGNTISATIVAGSLSNVDLNTNANIALTKLATVNANRALQSDASGFIQASPVTATELGYVSGVTSSIQTQLDGKASTTLNNLGTTSINANLLPSGAGARNLGSGALPWGDTTTNNINSTQINMFNSIGGSGRGQIDATSARTLASGDVSEFTIWAPNFSGTDIGIQAGDPASGPTGSLFLSTGNASVNNNSGSIKLYTGTVSGTGVRGSIQFVDASLASASVGYIWTLQNTSTGAGAWAVAAAGYTDEQAQDAVGNILTDSATIDFTYNDAGNTISAIVIDGSISDAKIASGVDAAKIGAGTVSNTEFGYLDGVTSAIQTQLDGKASTTLNNLGVTAVNANLNPDTSLSRNLGNSSLLWNSLWSDVIRVGTVLSTRNAGTEQLSIRSDGGTTPSGVSVKNTIATDTAAEHIAIFTNNNGVASASGNIYLETGNKTSGAQNTGNILLKTGNQPAGNSGNVELRTGTASGTRGTINLVDGSLAGAAAGYVWTLSNASTGAGNWAVNPAAGITTLVAASNATLTANTSNEVISGLTFAHASFNGCNIEYRVKKGTLVRTGRFTVATDGTTVAFNDMFVETLDSSLVFEAVINGSNINIRQTNTETGTINISFEQRLFPV